MPPELRARIEQACEESGRSMNAEIVRRLEYSFDGTLEVLQAGLDAGREIGSQAIQIQQLTEQVEDLQRSAQGANLPEALHALKEAIEQRQQVLDDAVQMLSRQQGEQQAVMNFIARHLTGREELEKAAAHFQAEQSKLADAARKVSGQDQLEKAVEAFNKKRRKK